MFLPPRLAVAPVCLVLLALVGVGVPPSAASPPDPVGLRTEGELGRGPTSVGAPGAAAAPFGPTPVTALPFEIPAPTGPLPVGGTTLRLVDRSRIDPWVPASGPRRVVVSLFYPALTRGGRPFQYMTAAESEAVAESDRSYGLEYPAGTTDDVWSRLVTGAQADVLPRPELGGRPLVLLSPGLGMQRSTLTSQATDLASRGYLVALMDHTYENTAESLGNGVVASCVICDLAAATQTDAEFAALAAQVTRVRAADASFVLDQLLKNDLPVPCLKFIDPRRIAMVGHSIGGASALQAMVTDRRIVAGGNLDGAIWEPLRAPMSRPFLLLATDHVTAGEGFDLHPSWARDWPRLTGFRRSLVVSGTYHSQISDYGPIDNQLGYTTYVEDGFVSGLRALEITRAYVAAFLDRTLRGQDPALLRGPSAAYPEVTFRDPH